MFTYTGYCEMAVKAHLNSMSLVVRGHKQVAFKDGMVIRFDNYQDTISNTFIGTCYHNQHNSLKFEESKSGLTGYIDMGNVKGRVGDYFTGKIENAEKEVVVPNFSGTYMGYVDIDGERWYDLREKNLMEFKDLPIDSKRPLSLPSDSRKRTDLSQLLLGNVEDAQQNKETIEAIQRRDRKLRAAAEARRKAGGPKITLPAQKETYYKGI